MLGHSGVLRIAIPYMDVCLEIKMLFRTKKELVVERERLGHALPTVQASAPPRPGCKQRDSEAETEV